MQELSWDDLKVLLACSRHGSTRTAASALGVSNSTVARRLEVLEAAIEGRLFDRTPDGLLATALCEELLPIAKTVEDTISDEWVPICNVKQFLCYIPKNQLLALD